MNKQEYAEYEKAVGKFFEAEKVTNLSPISDNAGAWNQYFSWAKCDCCGSFLGGDRIDCNGFNPDTGDIQEYSACVDCVYYVEYGQLDDMTMLSME